MPTRKKSYKESHHSLRTRLLGSGEVFSFGHRMFNLTSIITLAILSAFIAINLIINEMQAALLVSVLFCVQLFFYVLSRKFRQYKKIIVWYVVAVYSGLIFNYYVNAGINGPSLLLFYTTFQLALNVSARKKYILWMILGIVIPAGLIFTELYYPQSIISTYDNKTDKMIDLFGSYVLALVYIVFASNSFKRELEAQHEREKKDAAELMEYGIRLQAFFESLSDNFILLDKEMKILYFNKAAYDLSITHYDTEITLYQRVDEFIHDSNKKGFFHGFNTALSGQAITMDFRRVYAIQDTWWQITFNPARNDKGDIIGVTTVMKDITEAYLYRLRIERKNELLEKIAFIQAHELRGPLTSVQSLIGLIKDEYCDMDLVYTRKLEEGLNRLDDKIKEIVALSSEHKRDI
ncbi:PAS domain-containing protein [Chitinophaga rhizophila]|uniref:histidine kinase n=1 Tax=Chitinophaga rhizophila TaxID=2866212 RepID=A0ABS7GIR2_9BACT|nr:PAS domain-containing protein [Chitinophaga rhizophila]MBW8687579.1 PAS domain-containing protein [Chitinophaga rhizophila]